MNVHQNYIYKFIYIFVIEVVYKEKKKNHHLQFSAWQKWLNVCEKTK